MGKEATITRGLGEGCHDWSGEAGRIGEFRKTLALPGWTYHGPKSLVMEQWKGIKPS
jgi:hypothetical protein